MKQYIDKDALVAEIEKRRRDWCYGSSIEAKYKREECDDILSFLDTIEVKEVDLNPTLEDISIIRQIMFDYNRQVRNEMSIPNDKEYCQEVLKRFKAQKGEEV